MCCGRKALLWLKLNDVLKPSLSGTFLEGSLLGEAGAALFPHVQAEPLSTTGFHNCWLTEGVHKMDPEWPWCLLQVLFVQF